MSFEMASVTTTVTLSVRNNNLTPPAFQKSSMTCSLQVEGQGLLERHEPSAKPEQVRCGGASSLALGASAETQAQVSAPQQFSWTSDFILHDSTPTGERDIRQGFAVQLEYDHPMCSDYVHLTEAITVSKSLSSESCELFSTNIT